VRRGIPRARVSLVCSLVRSSVCPSVRTHVHPWHGCLRVPHFRSSYSIVVATIRPYVRSFVRLGAVHRAPLLAPGTSFSDTHLSSRTGIVCCLLQRIISPSSFSLARARPFPFSLSFSLSLIHNTHTHHTHIRSLIPSLWLTLSLWLSGLPLFSSETECGACPVCIVSSAPVCVPVCCLCCVYVYVRATSEPRWPPIQEWRRVRPRRLQIPESGRSTATQKTAQPRGHTTDQVFRLDVVDAVRHGATRRAVITDFARPPVFACSLRAHSLVADSLLSRVHAYSRTVRAISI